MSSKVQVDLRDCLLSEPKGEVSFEHGDFKRIETPQYDSFSKKVDIHGDSGLQVHFLQVNAADGHEKLTLYGQGEVFHCLQTDEMGTILRVRREGRESTVWFPPGWGQYSFDKHKRIGESKGQEFSYQLEFFPRICLTVMKSEALREKAAISYVVSDDSTGQFFQELVGLQSTERCLYIKSEWFSVRVPSDVWKYLINGSIYDPRSHKSIGKRFKCQQCAYAWWTYFDFLHTETGKKIYDIMQNEVAYSVLMDMTRTGEWGHGFWSDDIETHARFHLDGLHLLISQYEKTREAIWLEAAERGMTFISTHLMEQLDDGSLWFLHDTIEKINKNHHFKSALFGKSPGNSLCINTHVQALTVLHRLRRVILNRNAYSEMFEKGVRALRRVLACNSGEAFFKILVPWIVRNITRTKWHSNTGRLAHGFESRLIRMVLGATSP